MSSIEKVYKCKYYIVFLFFKQFYPPQYGSAVDSLRYQTKVLNAPFMYHHIEMIRFYKVKYCRIPRRQYVYGHSDL